MTEENHMIDARTPLTNSEREELRLGDWVRIELPVDGMVLQGPIERRGGTRGNYTERVTIHGVSLYIKGTGIDVYRVAEGSDIIDQARTPVDEAAVEAFLAAASAPSGTFLGGRQAVVVTLRDMVRALIGFDPAIGMTDSGRGGKSYEGYANQFLSVSALKKLLARLVDEGKAVAVTMGKRGELSEHSRYVTFRGTMRSGWVAREAYDIAVQAHRDQSAKTGMEKLRAEARGIVADRHADEVETVLAELLARD